MVEQAAVENSGPGDLDCSSHKFGIVPISGKDHRSFVVIERSLQPGSTIFYHINSLPKYHASHRVLEVLRDFIFSAQPISWTTPPEQLREVYVRYEAVSNERIRCMLHYMHRLAQYVAEKKPL
ncbi:hypothetical protein PHYSODRAFT_472272 [Phytophthora sojae]|uniref:Uncharacterized protein n=1 Tax=Phytophthora sojae (strain P6497) TaxID=1094619 RepID=G4YM06_PHYSP|nr:hypothetical protein PHYSODRAFT_472272 [Phytophthora sojae]EGZ27536.1 hypothetical protein PHYSODRAFT_472272 [Phytophthora sojae]|eukprot:XP_009514811.1 hypothetical protein PHYSODRAFT_472272 [Phytophthora sojae]